MPSPTAAAPPPVPARGFRRLRTLAPARLRLWGLLVPIHVAAFAVLYAGTYGLLVRAHSDAAAAAARYQLDQAVRDMPFLVQSSRPGRTPHVFEHLLVAHQAIALRIYRPDGTPLGGSFLSGDPAEIERVQRFLADGERQQASWIERDGERAWARGLVRLTAGTACTPCHEPGDTVGAATMRADFTAELAGIRAELGGRVALLLAAWVALVAGMALLVQRTVRRSAARLRADLDAAAAGGAPRTDERAPGLPLDPVAAEVHRGLRELLRQQRERESRVATRLAHVDQLATLGQLAAGLAHEIKNPLAGIQGALELLRDEARDEAAVRLHDEMLAELKRVHVILHRLLESGRPAPLRRTRTDLARLVDETAELLRPSLRRQRVELRVERGAGALAADLDAAKIRQVLVNLIQNAAEAMGESGGQVVVRASRLAAEPMLVVAVEDDGPGIAPENRERIFDPFFTTKFAGTGLGLAISKGIVEQHGGRMEVASEPGKGTTFFLFLPLEPNGASAPGTES
jgi:signal transduction histidine kinase